MKPSVLVVEDDRPSRQALEAWLEEEGYDVTSVASGEAGVRALQNATFSAILCDVCLGEGMSGTDLLRRARGLVPDALVVLMTGYGSVNAAVEAIKLGAHDYFTKPLDLDRLGNVLTRGLAGQRLAVENRLLKAQLRDRFSTGNIIGRSQSLLRLLDDLERMAISDATVLLTGESGVGKDLFASALHRYSPRADQPFVQVNCPALAEGVLESELFGHEKGAFTGAARERRGRFELAHRGTLFLDEIGELGLGVQAKLLRALENGTVERVGSSYSMQLDVRMIAATNKDLEKAVARGRFRADLFYRLGVLRIHIPPLRERTEDIPLLVEHFLADFNKRHSREVSGVSSRVMRALVAWTWPGNVRELRNCIERSLVLCRGNVIDVKDLALPAAEPPQQRIVLPVGTTLADAERRLMRATLDANGGNKARTARMLGVGLRTLYRRLDEPGPIETEE
jgi:DNA-binding NtrC family response regulator